MKIDLLQQALLVMAQRYPSLALKLAWSLLAILADYAEKKISQVSPAVVIAAAVVAAIAIAIAIAVAAAAFSVSSTVFLHTLAPLLTYNPSLSLTWSYIGAIRRQRVAADAAGDGRHRAHLLGRRRLLRAHPRIPRVDGSCQRLLPPAARARV